MIAALDDDAHADEQRERYRHGGIVLRAALAAAGWVVEDSEAGLYLWASRPGSDGWASARMLAEAGILVSPGELYGAAGRPAHPRRADRHRRARRRRGRPPHRPRLTLLSAAPRWGRYHPPRRTTVSLIGVVFRKTTQPPKGDVGRLFRK